MIVPFAFVSTLLFSGAWASNVLELVPDNFYNEVGKGKPGLVELFVRGFGFSLRDSDVDCRFLYLALPHGGMYCLLSDI